jgi:hypothetical protein
VVAENDRVHAFAAAARAACTTALGHEPDLFLTAAAAGTHVEANA